MDEEQWHARENMWSCFTKPKVCVCIHGLFKNLRHSDVLKWLSATRCHPFTPRSDHASAKSSDHHILQASKHTQFIIIMINQARSEVVVYYSTSSPNSILHPWCMTLSLSSPRGILFQEAHTPCLFVCWLYIVACWMVLLLFPSGLLLIHIKKLGATWNPEKICFHLPTDRSPSLTYSNSSQAIMNRGDIKRILLPSLVKHSLIALICTSLIIIVVLLLNLAYELIQQINHISTSNDDHLSTQQGMSHDLFVDQGCVTIFFWL